MRRLNLTTVTWILQLHGHCENNVFIGYKCVRVVRACGGRTALVALKPPGKEPLLLGQILLRMDAGRRFVKDKALFVQV